MLPTPPTTRQQLGPPLDLSDDDLDALSQITLADVKKATALWHALAPAWATDLIDAAPALP